MRFPWISKEVEKKKGFGWEKFQRFTYSKHSHIVLFNQKNYEEDLYHEKKEINLWTLKRYQDLLVFSFIKQMVAPGSRLLEVGGGNSRIINRLKKEYECWNVDKLEGCGQGPKYIDSSGFTLIKDYMGNFNPGIPSDYFDFVFSISALEHVPGNDPTLHENILSDMNRVLKSGCYSLHCIDSVLKPQKLWVNHFLSYIFKTENTFNRMIPYEEILKDKDIFVLSEYFYNLNWFPLNGKTYQENGRPFSYNVLWKKR